MTMDELATMERESIRAFVESCAEHFTGQVLDYGCGRQPYRDVVEKAGGEYLPWDRKVLPGGSVADFGPENAEPNAYDAILCTQVIQYVETVEQMPEHMLYLLRSGGRLVLTGPGCWPELPGHLHSHTREGIRRLLVAAGFTVERLESRGEVPPGFSLGYGAVARA